LPVTVETDFGTVVPEASGLTVQVTCPVAAQQPGAAATNAKGVAGKKLARTGSEAALVALAALGMGGLGHVGVQIAKAMGANVSVISHGRSKEADARRFGADHFYATSEEGVLESLRGTFDLILCTVSAEGLDYAGYMAALRPYGVFVDVGLPSEPVSLPPRAFVNARQPVPRAASKL